MMHLTFAQALSIWSDLCDAMHGRASHGDEAEVYAYRLMQCDPLAEAGQGHAGDEADKRERRLRAANALAELCFHFSVVRDVGVRIDGMGAFAWFADHGENFGHRVKVRVIGGAR